MLMYLSLEKQFKPSLMFAGEAGAYLSGVHMKTNYIL